MDLVLYIGDRHFSSWSMRARIALIEMGIDFTEVLVPLDWPIKFEDSKVVGIAAYDIPPEPAASCGCEPSHLIKADSTNLIKNSYASLIPRVPTLIDKSNNAVISDSMAIVEYINETYSNCNHELLGTSPSDRADIRSFCYHIHSDYLQLMGSYSYAKSFNPNKSTMEHSQEGENQLNNLLEIIDHLTKTDDFLFGKFSMADIVFAPIAQSIKGWDIKTSSNINKYINKVLSIESIAEHINEAHKYYNRLDQFEENTFSWIANHYRYYKEISLIHNWRTDIYHYLKNDIAIDFFELAFNGKSTSQIIEEISSTYQVDSNVVKKDLKDFFDLISPKMDSKHKNIDFMYE